MTPPIFLLNIGRYLTRSTKPRLVQPQPQPSPTTYALLCVTNLGLGARGGGGEEGSHFLFFVSHTLGEVRCR